ncbi:hypothetical protein Tco_1150226 [Tanacetum coccineum]
MYRMTTSFLQGEVAALSHGQRKASSSWKSPEGGNKPNFKKGFKNKQRPDRKPDRFSLLTPNGKFKAPPPMNDKTKAPKKGEASGKDKPLTILMIQPWERVTKPRITQSFSPETAMSFPPLREEDGTEGPMIIEVEMGGPQRDKGSNGSGHHSPYRIQWRDHLATGPDSLASKNRPGIRKIRAVPSTAHGMLKFPVKGGTVTLQSSRVIPMECAMISGPSIQSTAENQVLEEKINIAIHPEYPEQTVAIGSTLTEKRLQYLAKPDTNFVLTGFE